MAKDDKLKLKPIQDAIKELAAAGMNKTAIARKLDIGRNIFSDKPLALKLFNEGRDALIKKVSESIIEASTTSYLDRKILAQKLNLFSEPFSIKVLKTPEDARDLISLALQKFTAGEIDDQSLGATVRAANAFIESFNQSVLQQDMAELKKLFEGRK